MTVPGFVVEPRLERVVELGFVSVGRRAIFRLCYHGICHMIPLVKAGHVRRIHVPFEG